MPRVGPCTLCSYCGPFELMTSQLTQPWFECCLKRRKEKVMVSYLTLQVAFLQVVQFLVDQVLIFKGDDAATVRRECQGTGSSVTWKSSRLFPGSYITPTRNLSLCVLPRLIPPSDARSQNRGQAVHCHAQTVALPASLPVSLSSHCTQHSTVLC